MDRNLLAFPNDFTGGCCHGLQGLYGCFCFTFLHNTQNGVQKNHDQNDEYLCQTFSGNDVGDSGNRCSHHQNDQHGILQLIQETAEGGLFLRVLQLVGAKFRLPFLDFGS